MIDGGMIRWWACLRAVETGSGRSGKIRTPSRESPNPINPLIPQVLKGDRLMRGILGKKRSIDYWEIYLNKGYPTKPPKQYFSYCFLFPSSHWAFHSIRSQWDHLNLFLMLLAANFAIKKMMQKSKKNWLKPWHMGTLLGVLSERVWQHDRVWMVFFKSLHPCALDESSLSIGRAMTCLIITW